ncbi:MAG: colicin immunity domain-containing protein [Candidatus Acidiferrales bacterium]
MENYGEVGVPEFTLLMRDFLEDRLDASQYAKQYFALMVKRMTLTEEESRVLQRAYGDADDYEADPAIELPNVLNEHQLRERVAQSLRELAELGYGL